MGCPIRTSHFSYPPRCPTRVRGHGPWKEFLRNIESTWSPGANRRHRLLGPENNSLGIPILYEQSEQLSVQESIPCPGTRWNIPKEFWMTGATLGYQSFIKEIGDIRLDIPEIQSSKPLSFGTFITTNHIVKHFPYKGLRIEDDTNSQFGRTRRQNDLIAILVGKCGVISLYERERAVGAFIHLLKEIKESRACGTDCFVAFPAYEFVVVVQKDDEPLGGVELPCSFAIGLGVFHGQ